MSSQTVEDAGELDELLAAWRQDDEQRRAHALETLDRLIATWCQSDDLRARARAQHWGETLLSELTPDYAERVFRTLLLPLQLQRAIGFAHNHGGGPAAHAVEALMAALRLPIIRNRYRVDDPAGSNLTAQWVARSARGRLSCQPADGGRLDRMWTALRLRVCAARSRPSWQALVRSVIALVQRWLTRALGAVKFEPSRRRRPPPAAVGPPGACHYTAQPRLTRGPDACPSLTFTYVEGRARQRAPQGSAVAA